MDLAFLVFIFPQARIAAPALVLVTVKRQRESLHNPTKTAEELLETFEKQGLTKFVARLRPFATLV
ncbi:hypothetical protein [Planctomicrobium piriforme]|uniref:VapC50 C-terminal domain-containing protein n=1 Tax=Planctomicrobium piriforme TaxID=1576369 RepID=A0A1I3GJW5_9PLAN|nr:hypothetical protein [Planctomicrobium piriforme]SFI23754.1 hypothetical protein SAMN05421753_10727 [Planctomicrobium piriforme]